MEKEVSSKIWVMGTSKQAAKLGWDVVWLPYRVFTACALSRDMNESRQCPQLAGSPSAGHASLSLRG